MATIIILGGHYSLEGLQVLAMSSAYSHSCYHFRGGYLPLLPPGKNPLPYTDTAVPSGHLWEATVDNDSSHIHAEVSQVLSSGLPQ